MGQSQASLTMGEAREIYHLSLVIYHLSFVI